MKIKQPGVFFKIFLSIYFFLSLTSALWAQSVPVKVGVLLAQTGELAPLSHEVQRGIELAADEVGSKYPIELVYEDIGSLNQRMAASAAQKLLNIDKVQVALSMILEEAAPIIPIFRARKTPLVVLWDSNETLSKAGEYIFSSGYSTEKSALVAADYALDILKLKRFAVVGHISPSVEIFSRAFADQIKKRGGEVVYSKLVSADLVDFKAILPAIKSAKPDGVYFLFFPPFSGTFLRQANEINLKASFLSADIFTSDSINTAGGSAEGVYYTNIYAEHPNELNLKYQRKYGAAAMDISLVSLGYDGLLKTAEAFPLLSNKTTLCKAMQKVFGSTGSTNRKEKLFRVVDGKQVEIK